MLELILLGKEILLKDRIPDETTFSNVNLTKKEVGETFTIEIISKSSGKSILQPFIMGTPLIEDGLVWKKAVFEGKYGSSGFKKVSDAQSDYPNALSR